MELRAFLVSNLIHMVGNTYFYIETDLHRTQCSLRTQRFRDTERSMPISTLMDRAHRLKYDGCLSRRQQHKNPHQSGRPLRRGA